MTRERACGVDSPRSHHGSMNSELSQIFDEMAAILELTGANRFRVTAHARVARVLRDLADDVSQIDPEHLTDIDGIGDGSAKKILEYFDHGHIEEHRELLGEIPDGLLDVLKVPGLGPKTVRAMWEHAGVTDIPSLRAAIEDGSLENVPRMGRKTIENIRDGLDFLETSSTRTRLGQALPVAEKIVEALSSIEGVASIEYAGSLRRGRDTIGDIDILVSAADHNAVSEAFRALPGVDKVLAAGETKSSIRLDGGMQVDLRIVDASVYGAALLYFTGSKEHNVVLRERAIKRGFRLNEYGLFPHDDEDSPPQQRGVRPVASRAEEDIYEKLDLPWIPPEIREDRGEFDKIPPALIKLEDIRAELHAHTTASDGRMSIRELAEEARSRGFHTIAVTDHSRSSAQANGLDVERLLAHAQAVREVDESMDDITVLAGSEVDILADGRLDYGDDVLEQLDLGVASPHAALTQDAGQIAQVVRKFEVDWD